MAVKWSYSTIKKYDTCARQFHEVRVVKNFPEPETEQVKYGKEVHTAFEQYILNGHPLPLNYTKYQKYLDTFRDLGGTQLTEHKMALTVDLSVCEFESPDYWVRGIGDLIIIDGQTGYYVDYKTGSDRYADKNQLKLMAAMMFAHWPELVSIKAGLLFIAKNNFVDAEYSRRDDLLGAFAPALIRLEHSYKENWWPANPSGLCKKHCVVKTCKFNGRF